MVGLQRKSKKMKILLVFTEINQKFGPLRFQHGLAFISAVLKKSGFLVCLSLLCEEPNLPQWEEDLRRIQPNVIGFYSTAEQFPFVQRLIERVPPGIFTICGGPHPTCYPTCIESVPRLDAICVGEGEYPMLELVEALKEGRDYTRIKNLWVRRNGAIIRNETRPFIENLDELPYEDRDLFNMQESIDKYGLGQMRVLTSRGCPYQCTYCSNKRTSEAQPGRYLRYRTAEHIMGELNELNRKYRFDEIFFDDDIFMMNKNIRGEFCERYAREIGKPFVFCARVELCERDMLAMLKNAGGRRIDFGVESGNEELRRSILKRKMTNKQILDATQMAKSVGLQVKTLNMVGLPDETVEKHLDTVRINQQIDPDVVSMSIFTPYPGTELHDYCVQKNYYKPTDSLPDDYISRRESLLEMPFFSKEDIGKCFRRFGFRVFRKSALIKALGLAVIYSQHGEFFLDVTRGSRKILRKLLKGY